MADKLGIYIHIPFCRSKCDYCDFYSLAGREGQMDLYQRALLAHLREKPRPLALYVFSKGRSAARQALHTLSFGGGCWNDTIVHLANGNLPFGGIGESGMGRCHGEWGFRTFSHEKGLLHRYSLDVPVRYPPHAGKGLGMLKKLM